MAERALTRTGQVKDVGGRHEKDDRSRIDDRSGYVLGWSVEQKIDALLAKAQLLAKWRSRATADRDALVERLNRLTGRHGTLSKLVEFTDFGELDWGSAVQRVERLRSEKRQLEAASGELARLTAELDRVARELTGCGDERDTTQNRIGRVRGQFDRAEQGLRDARRLLDEPGYGAALECLETLGKRVGDTVPAEPAGYDWLRDEIENQLRSERDEAARRQVAASNRAVGRMADFRRRYPLEAAELDNAIQSAGEYRAMRDRLIRDDLPRFEAEFKTYLNTNTIRDIASFHSQLNKQAELIRERITTINQSLVGIDYNPGRYIRLDGNPTPNVDIRDFIGDLRACTDNSLGGDDSDQYSEQKFLQVKRIIERFQGREGFTDVDRIWARRVTDVRNWFVFSASERWREDDAEHETYTDSGGKSGGQKEKLAYTILAASLAYQFKLDSAASGANAFRFVVIDEAFGRGSETSTRFALALLPARAVIDSSQQLWALLRVDANVATYERLLEATQESAPALLDWMVAHPTQVLGHADRWGRLVDAVLWIDRNGRPETYLRHVDVPGVDTKFIEQHRGVLAGLLDRQLEPCRIDQAHPPSRFAQRYGFRSKPVYVRLRALGRDAPTPGPYREVTVRVEELAATPAVASRVIVVENEITYLALPPVDDAVAVLGGGYALSGLAPLDWLNSRELVYWGDLDTHGFAILDRLRQIFPHTRSILMDRATLLAHRDHWGREPSPVRAELPHLHPAEADLYADLLADRYASTLRLEQERIRFGTVERALRRPDASGG